uniref:Uncharacterized protein n=1 Tax=Halamphora calidilacuna TaxID=2133758 RepID=A0A2R4A3R6_9STRA|nr:hypothetical protein [Halamphora calidilacuna]
MVWLLLFITVYWWSNNFPDSSTSIPTLKSTGRLSAIKWILIQLSNPDYLIMVSYVLVDSILLFASWVLFILLYLISTEAKIFINNLLKFSLNLLLINKYPLYIFTTVFAVPNKIFINHGLNSYLVSFFVILLFLLSQISSFLILPLVFYLLLAVESIIFAFLYENESKTFKTYLDNLLFAGNPEFAKQYFKFFWGNMDKAGKTALKSGLFGWMVRTGWNTVTELENRHAQEESERRTVKAVQTFNIPTSAEKVMKMTEAEKAKIMKQKATFSNAEEALKQKLSKATDKILASLNKQKKD